MKTRDLLAAGSLVVLMAVSPAQAFEFQCLSEQHLNQTNLERSLPAPGTSATFKDPKLASNLSIWTPSTLALAGLALGGLTNRSDGPLLLAGLGMLATGAGQIYAGDWTRGLLVGFGGPLVFVAGGLGGGALGAALAPGGGMRSYNRP